MTQGTGVLTARVPAELAEWATAYAKERGVTRQAVIEEALREFREACEGGPREVAVARVSRPRAVVSQVPGVTTAGALLLGSRQQALNEAKARAAGPKKAARR